MTETSPALLPTRLFCDAVVKKLNFYIEIFEGALTPHAFLAGCRGLAGYHRFDELFEVGAAIIYVSHMVRTAPRHPCQSKVRRDGCRRLITLRRAECSCPRQQQERSHDHNYYTHHAHAPSSMLCSQTRYFLVSAHYPRAQSNSLAYETHSLSVRAPA
jgi:hypothetical protein